MTSHNDLWQEEQRALEQLRLRRPELFGQSERPSQEQLLKHAGIETISGNLPEGYYRLFPQDFIVEEVAPDGTICTVEIDEPSVPPEAVDIRTLYCELVKVGMYTLEARQRLASALGIPPEQIGYAGIKDAVALTGQRISLRKVTYEQIAQLAIPGIALKHFSYGSGVVSVGELSGNRFTILVRTNGMIDQQWLADMMDHVQMHGVPNYYGLQRFGSRYSMHTVGRKLLRGDYAGALRAFLTGTNGTEAAYVADTRKRADALYGNWRDMEKIFLELPYTFRNQLQLVRYLMTHADDVMGALQGFSEQVRLWVYAYVSYLFNKKLSQLLEANAPLPGALPLLFNEEGPQEYEDLLREDQTAEFRSHIQAFPFVRPSAREVPTLVAPEMHFWQATEEGVILSFTLPKAAYATTILTYLFQLETGLPVPPWVSLGERDILAIAGLGSIESAVAKFGKDIFSHAEQARKSLESREGPVE
ncbi:MAG: tRNA pseudouridine(13) synthase TruD [Parcubacteria group bacterium]